MTKPENLDGRVLAVDGDIVAYRIAAVIEDHFEGAGYAMLHDKMKEIATITGVSKMRVYLSGQDNFRYTVATTKPYKGNRVNVVRPKYLNACKQYLVDNYNAIYVDGFEADDAIASDMAQNNAIHCGIDKDIKQVPGDHYNFVKQEWEHIDEEEGTLRLYRQVLMGDTSDNIPGLPLVGEKKAEKWIDDALTAHDEAIDIYKDICSQKLGMNEVEALQYFTEQKMLVEMVTTMDLLELFTCDVDADDGGFEAQEGDGFEAASDNKTEPKL